MFLLKDKQRKNYSLRLLISTCKSRESLFEKNMDGKVYCHLLNNVTRVPAKKSPVKPLTYKFYPQAPIFCCYIWDTLYKTSSLYNQYNNQKRKNILKQNIIYQSLRDDQRTRLFLFSWSSGWFDLPIGIWQLPCLSSFLCKCCLVQYRFHIPPVQTFSQTWVGRHLNLQGVKKKP